MKELIGLHHVTAITSSAEDIYQFFTFVLGLRLVKKTINQDDIETYHLFFADDKGSAGTDMTFFDFKESLPKSKGTDALDATGFRVPNDQAVHYFKRRFDRLGVKHDGIKTLFKTTILPFYDFDDQAYILFSDEYNQGVPSGTPWKKGPIPDAYAITGLGPMMIRVSQMERMQRVLEDVLTFKPVAQEGQYHLYETGAGGHGASIILIDDAQSPQARMGFGSIHHVAFRVTDEQDIHAWIDHLKKYRAPQSGLVDRFYFTSLYTRLYPGILFEFATEGPGFIDDEEPYETLGETLALPPKFRGKRELIESFVRHIDTKRSDRIFEKEYEEVTNHESTN